MYIVVYIYIYIYIYTYMYIYIYITYQICYSQLLNFTNFIKNGENSIVLVEKLSLYLICLLKI